MSLNYCDDTIVAIATPMGIGALAIIRVSGSQAISLVDFVFHGRKKLSQVPSHTIHYGKILDKEGIMIDDVLVSIFRKPHSYTGEDSCEISTHGNPLIARKVIELLLSVKNDDVRLAEPGEFTKRAFLNGRLDLAQAEAVVDVIESATDASLRGARNQLDGILSQKITQLRQQLIDITSLIEVELDFSEEDISFIHNAELVRRIKNLIAEIQELLDSYRFGKVLRDGVNVAIVGKPNVGKSSLLNYLLKESRAIVSSIPGTTRDIIREDMTIEGILFRLFDTAGIRFTQDPIEKEGVERSCQAVRQADLVIFLNEANRDIDIDLQQELLHLTSSQRLLTILNKSDLAPNCKLPCDLKISAKTGEGVDELCKLLYQKAIGSKTYSEHSAVVSNLRHFQSLQKAKQSLEQSLIAIEQKLTGEFVSVDLRNSTMALSEIIGVVTSDDILNTIFSRFCIGK